MRFIGNVEKDAQVRAVASLDMSAGDPVVVNDDGTVTAAQIITTSISEAFGSQTDFFSNRAYGPASAFDSVNNKIVIAYQSSSDNKGYCVVGTVSDVNSTTITFGTPVAIHSTASLTHLAIAFDTNSGKFGVFYTRSGDGYGKVGTVSGTSISFGSESSSFWTADTVKNTAAVFDASQNVFVVAHTKGSDSANVRAASISGTSLSWGIARQFDSNPCEFMAMAFNPDRNNNILIYRDPGTSGYGKALTLTLGGTSITTSSNQYVYNSGSTREQSVVYDTSQNRFLITYRDVSNSSKGTAVVATASGSGLSASFSFGSETIYADLETRYTSSAFDSNVNKTVVFYEASSTGRGFVAVGDMSGTSVTFDTPVQITPDATHIADNTSVFDSSTNTVVCSFDDSVGTEGASVVFRNASSESNPNLTSENFVGFAAHTYADTQSALVNSTCTVDRNQSGLTAGQKYYVQADGTLDTTADDPSVEAGTAISSTEIIVKG